MDKAELTERARKGLPLYGHSDEPEWVQGAAYRNSAFSQLKFSEFACALYMIACTDCTYLRPIPNVRIASISARCDLLIIAHRLNLVNHPYHGTDPSKYTENAKNES